MKKTFGIALFALVAALSFAPAANAQSHRGDHRGGVNVDIRGGNRGVGVEIRGGNRGYENRGYDHRGYDRGWDHRGGFGIDIRIGRPGIYIPGPVYREPGCYDGCGRGYDYTPAPISVRVIDLEPVYDRYGYRCGTREVERFVTAYWDNARGGYYYVNRFGEYVRVR